MHLIISNAIKNAINSKKYPNIELNQHSMADKAEEINR